MQTQKYLVKEELVIEINVIGYKTEGESSVVFIKYDSEIAFSIVVDCFCYQNKNKTIEILRNNNVKSIDYLCWSHPDYDHSHGMCDIFTEFVNEKTIINIPENVDNAYEICSNKVKDLFDTLKKESCKRKTNVYTVSDNKNLLYYRDDILFLYDDYDFLLKMESFAPNSSLIREEYLSGDFNKNDHSIGFTISLGGDVLMFTGDMGNTTIAELIKLPSQPYFLKIPHHGSETSSKMLDVLNFVNVACSTVYRKGKNNLPSQNIINSYKKKTNNLYITSSDTNNPNDHGYGVINISIDVLNDSFQTKLYGDAISVNCSK